MYISTEKKMFQENQSSEKAEEETENQFHISSAELPSNQKNMERTSYYFQLDAHQNLPKTYAYLYIKCAQP